MTKLLFVKKDVILFILFYVLFFCGHLAKGYLEVRRRRRQGIEPETFEVRNPIQRLY
jgi:hypothetical protein